MPWTSSTRSPLPNECFLSLVHHLWAFMYQPCMSFILHGNLVPHHYLASLAIILFCWPFPRSFMGFYGLTWYNILSLLQLEKGPALLHLWNSFKYTYLISTPTMKGISITLPHLPYNTMGFDTTCWERDSLNN